MNWHKTEQEDGTILLRLDGPMTVEHTGALRSLLLDALAAPAVTVELGDDLTADVAGLQMLCSAHRTFTVRGKKFTLKQGTPDTFRNLVRDAGLLRHQGCSLNPFGNCLWIGGNL